MPNNFTELTIDELYLQLTDDVSWGNVRGKVDEAARENLELWSKEIARLIRKVIDYKPDFARDYPEKYQRYIDLIQQCRWIHLSHFSTAEWEDFFAHELHNYFALPAEYDLREAVRKCLTLLPFEERDPLKEKLRNIMLNNEELIGENKITRDGVEYAPTVGNWLRDYISYTAQTEKTFMLSKYVMENENMRRFDEGMKSKFRALFQLFDHLKFSTYTQEGLEDEISLSSEDGSQTGVFKNGEFYPDAPLESDKTLQAMIAAGILNDNEKSTPEMSVATSTPLSSEEIMKIYEGDKNENETVRQEKMKMQQLIKGNYGGLAEYFYQAVFPREGLGISKVRVIALLQLLAQNGLVDDIITTDQRIFNKVVEYLQATAGDKVADFKMHPTVPGNMALFLQYIFRDRLKLDDAEAARQTARLANYFKLGGEEKYANLVYFDMGGRGFRWK